MRLPKGKGFGGQRAPSANRDSHPRETHSRANIDAAREEAAQLEEFHRAQPRSLAGGSALADWYDTQSPPAWQARMAALAHDWRHARVHAAVAQKATFVWACLAAAAVLATVAALLHRPAVGPPAVHVLMCLAAFCGGGLLANLVHWFRWADIRGMLEQKVRYIGALTPPDYQAP